MTRTLEQIRSTDLGPRPIPPAGDFAVAASPTFRDTVLPNGLRVLLVRHASAPTVQLGLAIPFADPDPRHPARSAMVTNTILAGTSSRDRLAVDNALARIGATLGAASTPERLAIAGGSLSSGLATLLDTVADCVADAAYRDDEVALERGTLAQTLMLQRADPNTVAHEALQHRRYGDHPVARVMADAADVATVTPEELRSLHAAAVVPRGSTLVLVGDLDLDDALSEAERAFGRWSSDASAPLLPPVPEVAGGDLHVVNLPGAVQAHLRLSAQAVRHDDARYPALCLATLALGGGITGRLAGIIRERLALCYYIASTMEFTQDETGGQGTITATVNTATDTAADALRALRIELQRFRDEPPDEAELERTRRYAIGSQLMGAMSQTRLAQTLSGLAVCGLGVPWLATERELFAAVTLDEVADAANEFFDPARFTGVIVGDAAALANKFSDEDQVHLP